jgi:ribosomal protein S18 acetylase RimI-like enzyme
MDRCSHHEAKLRESVLLVQTDLIIRPVQADDDLDAITAVIRSAYAELSAMGFRYWATHQSAADTADRFAKGCGFVALRPSSSNDSIRARIVGTITVNHPDPDNQSAIYRDPTTYGIGQFAVDPAEQGRGLGRRLHDHALDYIQERGGRRAALDTAEGAHHLIALYEGWGYRIVENVDWRPFTNYLSVVMVKELTSL